MELVASPQLPYIAAFGGPAQRIQWSKLPENTQRDFLSFRDETELQFGSWWLNRKMINQKTTIPVIISTPQHHKPCH